jgi:predicted deacylase
VKPFELNDLRVAPGTIGKGYLGEVVLSSGARIGIPVAIANGVEDGPTLVITGSMHGEEIVGCGALHRVLRVLDPSQMRGSVIAVTVTNPLAFQNNTYATPYDSVNLCGPLYWPGNPKGTTSERVAWFVGQAIRIADYYVDLHANSPPCVPMVMVFLDQARDDSVRRETLRIAEAFGFSVVDMPGHPEAHGDASVFGSPAGYPAGMALSHGIPALQPELTGNPILSDVELGRIALMNMMRELKMLEDEREMSAAQRIAGDWIYHGALMNDTGGLLWVREPPGTLLEPGALVAEITNVWGDTAEEIRMPVAGWCWAHAGGYFGRGTHAVPEGTMVGFVATSR